MPNSAKIPMDEYLCDCDRCLNLEFSLCKKPVASVGEIRDNFLKEYMVGDDTMSNFVFKSKHAILCKLAFVQCQ